MSRYLDIDLIMAEEDRLPCLFLHDSAGMGHLDSTMQQTRDNVLPAQSRVEVPYWLAQELKLKSVVEMEAPKFFGVKMRSEMRAGAAAINLREFSYYFFDVGMRLSVALRDKDLLQNLRQAFLGERYRKLMVRALGQGAQDDLSEFCQSLTSSEMAIFRAGSDATQAVHRWRTLESSLLQGSRVLGKGRTGEQAGGGKRARA